MFRLPSILLSLSALLVACQPPLQPVDIEFAVRFAGEQIHCAEGERATTLSDARFFVHDIRLLTDDRESVPVSLAVRPPWQTADVALLDFEDGTGNCQNGSAQKNTHVTGFAPVADYRGLAFTVGVPEAVNHADPLRASAPLSLSAMHWHWRSGYKFMRAGIRRGADGFWLHLGSTRCEGVIGDLQGCANSNRPTILLTDFAAGTQTVVLDLQALFASALLDDGQVEGCEMGPDETVCTAVLAKLGLDRASGNSHSPASVFRAAARE